MQLTDNTVLITGGASGIGRALAEAFHAQGNRVVIAGRRQSALDEVTAANPGMQSHRLDLADPVAIESFAAEVARAYPTLNVLINNAGIMQREDLKSGNNLEIATETIAINLLGPIRLTAALLHHLQAHGHSTVITVSSGLAFVPMAATPTYSATKAAIHSWTMSLRHQLAGTMTGVIEIVPPYVQTELTGAHQLTDERAMPLDSYIAEVMDLLATDATEIVVERCKPLRFAAANGNEAAVFDGVNSMDD